jgi:hypothetical protein
MKPGTLSQPKTMRVVKKLLTILLMCAVPLYGYAALVEQCRCEPPAVDTTMSAMPCHGAHAAHHPAPAKPAHCKFGEKCPAGGGLNLTAVPWAAPVLPASPQLFPAPVATIPIAIASAVWRPPRS